ncbi:MAG: hypothetical protein CENE_01723 [Candidatus Celerinatantimonas neptuna]|nr:MAG: hypothetical protein CENE_01723 [Candidatus Celerinatantimonas neptuna]
MDITQYDTIVIDCDGILINHAQGILTNIYELQQDLPQNIAYRNDLIQRYFEHYYGLSDSISENGFCASHCFAFQQVMKHLSVRTNWREALRFARSVNDWPVFEDAYGALHYLRKFFHVLVRCDREPEDVPSIVDKFNINHRDIIIRTPGEDAIKSAIVRLGQSADTCLHLTSPFLAPLSSFENIQIIRRNDPAYESDDSLARVVMEHQSHLRHSWH